MHILGKQLRSTVTHVNWPALRTDVATAGGLGCAGDFICQQAVEGQSSMDWRRFAAVSTFAAMYMGGVFHFLCQIFPLVVCAVGRHLPARYALARQLQTTGSAAHSFGCAIADNIHDGALMIPTYFLGVGMLQGDSFEQARRNLSAEWRASYLADAGFWLPVMSANFALVPAQYRVRTLAAANTAWSVIIDYLAHRSRSKPRCAQQQV
jgi:hypothetical protein